MYLEETMPRHHTPRFMWSVGLDTCDSAFLAECAGKGWQIRSFDSGDQIEGWDHDRPAIVWVSQKAWKSMGDAAIAGLCDDEIPHILLLDETDDPAKNGGLENGPSPYILRKPLFRAQVLECLDRAIEASSRYSDMLGMTKELLIERELLESKNATLSFLVTFLAQANGATGPEDIFKATFESLHLLLPVVAVHGVIWQSGSNSGLEYFLATKPDSNAERTWQQTLHDAACKLNPALPAFSAIQTKGASITRLEQSPEAERALPAKQMTYLMPLSCGNETIGIFAIRTSEKPHMGKDQATALNSAMQHASLAMRSALRLREACILAEHDSLTGLYNRLGMDRHLKAEVERHTRYADPLSVLHLDLDYFKRINDTWGHQAGDEVLVRIGSILNGSLRSLDIAARYGGEEFIVLLPHTDSTQAQILAERLRQCIADQCIHYGNTAINFTASIGIATLEQAHRQVLPEAIEQMTTELIHRADMALYQAKMNGRNKVAISKEIDYAEEPARAFG